MNQDQEKNGYAQIYLGLVKKLGRVDLTANAHNLGLKANDDGSVNIKFFGREYKVDNEGVWPLDGRLTGVNHLSLVAHYAMSQGLGEPSGQFLPLRRLTGMVEGQNTYERDAVATPLARKFGDQPALESAIARIGGHPAGRDASGALGWIFHAFPKVVLKLLYHEADDEFPAEYRLLFDSAATRFVEFEALGFLAGIFVRELCGR
ncbi:DUF3786 domain-containing protein [Deltaproteobacteria bacterium OttesenSCG-928-K17]|nr:DUF3786 domain-containing protein [Deltaproteobacteria bacterium OttesenSCG-928-K17]